MLKGGNFQFYIFVQTIDDKYLYQDQMHAAGLLRIKGNRYYTIRTCPNPHVLLLCHHWKYFISTMNKHKSYPFFTQIISLCIVDLIHDKEEYSISNIHEAIIFYQSNCILIWIFRANLVSKFGSWFGFIFWICKIACNKRWNPQHFVIKTSFLFCNVSVLFCIHYQTSA